MTNKKLSAFEEFINEQISTSTSTSPRAAVEKALRKWEKSYVIKFESEDKKRLISLLGRKIYTKPYSQGLTVFEYIERVSGREDIDFRQMFKGFDELYDILSKSRYGLYETLDENKWIMRLSNKGTDLFYFLSRIFAKLK